LDQDTNLEALAYTTNLRLVARVAPEAARAVIRELRDQRENLKLIASENFSSLATQCAMANLLTDKYAEGIAGSRFYAGCDNVDDIEATAARVACEVFGADHAYVQPHSGADANLVAFWAILTARVQNPELERLGLTNPQAASEAQWAAIRAALGSQRLLAMDFSAGGHLTHGYRHNVSAKMFEVHSYSVDPTSGRIDLADVRAKARAVKPLILLAGYSAYPRRIDFAELRAIADEVGATLMVDMAHFAGLVAGGVFDGAANPVPYADVVTTTTHKTLRGPRGGMVLCRAAFAEAVDKGCPMFLGGPLPHVMAAKLVSLREAARPEFKVYAHAIVRNAQRLAAGLQERGLRVLTGGTDNHQVLVDVTPCGLTGFQAEQAMRACGVTLNRNAIPFDQQPPLITSGIRLGTPAVTTLGMREAQMDEIADLMGRVLHGATPKMLASGKASKKEVDLSDALVRETRARAKALLDAFPLYPSIDLTQLERAVDAEAGARAAS
jgi:glycine hydroxymethyltransferase